MNLFEWLEVKTKSQFLNEKELISIISCIRSHNRNVKMIVLHPKHIGAFLKSMLFVPNIGNYGILNRNYISGYIGHIFGMAIKIDYAVPINSIQLEIT